MEFNGYKEAEKFDKRINQLLIEEPVSKENSLEWMKLCRTVSTTLNIINIECKERLKGIDQYGM